MSRLFRGIHYDHDSRPILRIGEESLSLLGSEGTLSFDTTQRFCIGWHDLATGENHLCPDSARTDPKYDTCPACQRRTGFNPAFYHAATVSPQQEARNNEPHLLYLAYMGPGYVKVGISWHKRGVRRLLDQGARSALILDTFPTARIARQYEASIAALPSIHETTSTATKLHLLAQPHSDATAATFLQQARSTIEAALETNFSASKVIHFDTHYHTDATRITTFTPLNHPVVSGQVMAIIGDIIFAHHAERFVALPLRRYTGYPATVSSRIEPLDLPAEQTSLFG